jgi:hypothetical protein
MDVAVVAETEEGTCATFLCSVLCHPPNTESNIIFVSFFLNVGAQVEIIELEMATTGSSRYTNSYLRSEDNVKPANVGSYLDHAFDVRIASVDNKSLWV